MESILKGNTIMLPGSSLSHFNDRVVSYFEAKHRRKRTSPYSSSYSNYPLILSVSSDSSFIVMLEEKNNTAWINYLYERGKWQGLVKLQPNGMEHVVYEDEDIFSVLDAVVIYFKF